MKKDEMKIGVWAFAIGVVLALVAAFIPASLNLGGIIVAALVILGIVVGFLNVTGSEASPFLMASVAVMIAVYTAGGSLNAMVGTLGIIGPYLLAILGNINVFVFPATIVVAIKSIYALAKD